MKKILLLFVVLLIQISVFGCTEYYAQGSGAGALLGGAKGTLLDYKNPWRGGVIGAAIGGVADATLTDISMRASREAAASGRPVEYRTEDERGLYRADLVDYSAQTKCYRVRERVWENDKLVRDQIREVCGSDKQEKTY
jgi:hypothetical protein